MTSLQSPVDVDALGPPVLPGLIEKARVRAAELEPALVEYAQLVVLLDALLRAGAITTREQADEALDGVQKGCGDVARHKFAARSS